MGVGGIFLTSSVPALASPGDRSRARDLSSTADTERAGKTVTETGKESVSRSTSDVPAQPPDHVQQALKELIGRNSELSIAVDSETKRFVVKVLDSETHEVIKQIPPEALIKLAEDLKKLNVPLVDEIA